MVDGRSLHASGPTQVAWKHKSMASRTIGPRVASPERYSSPVRHRPVSPHKIDTADALVDDKSKLFLALAAKERALSDLRERKREIEAQISTAEQELVAAKKQLSSSTSPLKCLGNQSSAPRDILQKDRELEAFQHLAEGVSAIWKDVVHATMGEHAAT